MLNFWLLECSSMKGSIWDERVLLLLLFFTDLLSIPVITCLHKLGIQYLYELMKNLFSHNQVPKGPVYFSLQLFLSPDGGSHE